MRVRMAPTRALVGAVALVSVIGTACHTATRAAPTAAATPAPLEEGYCWWAVFRSPLPADSVAARYARAYEQMGLSNVTWSHAGDTAWAHAGPTVLGGAHDDGTYAARMVAYWHGDSTHFRTYLSIAPPSGGWPKGEPGGSDADGARRIGLCGALGSAAHAQGTAPAAPDSEAKLELWRRY